MVNFRAMETAMFVSKGVLDDVMFFVVSAVGLLMLFVASRHIGTIHHRWVLNRHPERHGDATDSTGYLVSSALALLGLLIGFTFSMAVERFDERRHAVNEEANAISTVYIRAGLFNEPIASRLQASIAHYAAERREFVAAGEDQQRLDLVARRAAATQSEIWAIMKSALATPDGAGLTTATLTSMNEMFDMASTRQALIEAHIPPMVMAVLISFATATAYLLGYGSAHEQRGHNAATTIVFALVAIAIALIIDLDRPRMGFIKVDQDPMERVIISLSPPKGASHGQ
jgi:Protein of unknown function (DUF4239)